MNKADWENKKVLITGVSGFKGSWLAAALLKLKADVFGTVQNRNNPISAYSLFDLDNKIIKINTDVSERQQVYDMINTFEPEVIFHLAAKALVPVALRDPRRTYEINVMGTLNVIEACRKLSMCDRLLICSTDHVFGSSNEIPPNGYEEKDRVSYGGPYDTSKAMMELLVRSYYKTCWVELPSIGITRCANVFGFGDVNQRRIIPLFISSGIYKKSIELKYLHNKRQFIHIHDAINGYIKAAENLNDGNCRIKTTAAMPVNRTPFTQTFHFALDRYPNGSNVISMKELAEIVADLTNSKIDQSHAVDFAPNENDVQKLDFSFTRKELSWSPQKEFVDSLKEMRLWYENIKDVPALKTLINKSLNSLCNDILGVV